MYLTVIAAYLQESAKFKIDLVCMMEGIANISPVLADTVMEAGYHAIDVLCTKVNKKVDMH